MIHLTIQQLASAYFSEIQGVRRHIHAHPELALEEHLTAAYVANKLTEYGISFTTGIAQTGIVGTITGEKGISDKVIALRGDMDALPILEANDVSYKSTHTGVMHACGHDVHTACLLGALKILNELKKEFAGTIKFIFQPSEEKYPGGAKMMIEEGVLTNPTPAYIFGEHVLPTLEVGKVGFRSGMFMASADEIYLTVIGKGGHGATPELNVNPIYIASTILLELQQLMDRMVPEKQIPTVLSFGQFIADGKTNIVPDKVEIAGTFRTFNEVWRKEVHQLVEDTAKRIAKEMKGDCIVRWAHGYPFLVNNEALTDRAYEQAKIYLGEENAVRLPIRMTAEDFAYFAQAMPACFYRLGVRNEAKGIVSNLHTSTFDVDEKSIEIGMGLMAYLAIQEINS